MSPIDNLQEGRRAIHDRSQGRQEHRVRRVAGPGASGGDGQVPRRHGGGRAAAAGCRVEAELSGLARHARRRQNQSRRRSVHRNEGADRRLHDHPRPVAGRGARVGQEVAGRGRRRRARSAPALRGRGLRMTTARSGVDTVVSRDGTPISFERQGSGPALVLVDGALCYRGQGPSGPLASHLRDHFTVLTYDRRGRGRSGNANGNALEREIDDLDAIIEAAGGSAFVYGVSSGGALALEAAHRGLKIDKLAVYEAPFIVDGTHPPLPDDFVPRLDRAVAEG